jgi:hypothetical protein
MFSAKSILSYFIFCIACIGLYFYLDSYRNTYSAISSFEECVAQGYDILLTYPETCKTPDRRTFTNPNQKAQATSTQPTPLTTPTGKEDLIIVDSIKPGDTLTSSTTITGRARGFWFFEASFPVVLLDGKGNIVTTGVGKAGGDWMSEGFVPFTITLSFKKPITATGTLILKKDNPSGDPERDDSISIPVKFDQLERSVNIYLYNSSLDKDKDGNIMCSKQGLVVATRTIPFTITPLSDTLKLFIKGDITNEEKGRGLATGYPLIGLTFQNITLSDKGVLTLTLDDPYSKTSGGACRSSLLRAQLEATALQFKEVKSVIIKPDTLFQP